MKQLDTLLISARGIPAHLLPEIRKACARALFHAVEWSGESPVPDLPRAPTLLVAAQPSGTRRIPKEIVEVMTGDYPGLPLLLLCDEALVRPTMSLQDGMVNLLGSPLSPARIADRIEALFRDQREPRRRQDTLSMGVIPVQQPVLCISDERTRWSCTTVTCHGSAFRPDGPMVEVRAHFAKGITAVIPLAEDAERRDRPLGRAQVDQLVALADDARRNPAKERLLSLSIADRAGLVHLGPDADEWFIYWPWPDAPLVLGSATRLPRSWNLTRSVPQDGTNVLRLPAASGDLLVALSTHLISQRGRGEMVDIAEMATDGGQVAVSLLEGRLRESRSPLTGLVLEVF